MDIISIVNSLLFIEIITHIVDVFTYRFMIHL